MLPLLAALQLAAATPQPAARQIYHGRNGATSVAIPKLDAAPQIDGVLDESVWRDAALLTGFSVYQPVDHQPAPDSTEVLVWYSTDAIYFGIRAFEPHAPVRATLADRDHVSSDDNVEIHLDPFAERNRAFIFIVNPFGVQADGTKSEAGGFVPGSNVSPGQNDLSADFIWQSKGRLVDGGYEVEVRVPFSSLRYPIGGVQDWGLQIDRHAQHSAYEETWTPAVRASASFITQEGWLRGMSGMRHGQVIELNPELTNTVSGAPAPAPADWSYTGSPKLGGNVRWTLGSDFVLNGSVKPDFSQVEADALQIAADQRFALFYPEKRPFFVENSDQFNVPNSLVYTRRIVQPTAAAKLTGKIGLTDVAVLSALDQSASTANDHPLVDVVRLRRAMWGSSTAGLLYSDRVTPERVNRVFGADTRVLFGRLYYFQAQLEGSTTRDDADAPNRGASMWELVVDRTGRAYGFHYSILGIDSAFHADNGFVARSGIVNPGIHNRMTWYGGHGGLIERYNAFIHQSGVWRYRDFFAGRSVLEDQFMVQNTLNLRGGWQITANPALSSYAFDPTNYRGLYVGFTPMTIPGRTPTLISSFGVTTPFFRSIDATLSTTVGNDVDFIEASRIRRRDLSASVNLRPTDRIRVNGSYASSQYTRRATGERSFSTRIPRLKTEYQVARPLFVRVVAQYQSTDRLPLRDPTTGTTLSVRSPTGSLTPSTETSANSLRADWLISYRPSPGTVVFFGYGNTMVEPDALAFQDLRRVNDAFFIKLSYAFRLVR
ncbi:MAG TPA: DUF5916 domain-containing protein [Gemmatimonadaceae bacterium]